MPMTKIAAETVIDVVYENGMLKPLIELPLEEHKRYSISFKDEIVLKPIATTKQHEQYDPARIREYDWLRVHRQDYAGQYVALFNDQLIAHGTDGSSVLQQARAAGFPRALMVRVEALDEPPFGGW
jgi:predicted DNA-binding antitoxin AbrB/MazE fold protein